MFTINNDEALNLLANRVRFWTGDEETINLFSKMYEQYIDSGVFEGNTHSINEIVDNDYVNNCSIVTIDDFDKEDAKKLIELYNDGERDISCERMGYSFIESVDDEENPKVFLLRY